MQTTIYYSAKDTNLLNFLARHSRRKRKSKSAVIMSILEEHFESSKQVGDILVDQNVINVADLAKTLTLQQAEAADKLLGEIPITESWLVQKMLIEYS